ncbi:MAG: tRNA (adenosine(37)-N6)-threonylcarbamoyltransferase complex transferase subunit TsaD, partial [Pseudomonadota bacterium]
RGVLEKANLTSGELDGIGVTTGPGLVGGLIVGAVTAQAIAEVWGLPLIAINHLEAHALTARLTDNLAFPFLALLISGGHCQFVAVQAPRRYEVIGSTIDDSVGEAFDKVSKMLGLGYPGGPAVEVAAREGSQTSYSLPRPLLGSHNCNFSFSGLKTAVRLHVLKEPRLFESVQAISDLCASFQSAVGDILFDRSKRAIGQFKSQFGVPSAFVIAGGVAANAYLRHRLKLVAAGAGIEFVAPPPELCGDNAAMVAWAALEVSLCGIPQSRSFPVRSRWPLSDLH